MTISFLTGKTSQHLTNPLHPDYEAFKKEPSADSSKLANRKALQLTWRRSSTMKRPLIPVEMRRQAAAQMQWRLNSRNEDVILSAIATAKLVTWDTVDARPSSSAGMLYEAATRLEKTALDLLDIVGKADVLDKASLKQAVGAISDATKAIVQARRIESRPQVEIDRDATLHRGMQPDVQELTSTAMGLIAKADAMLKPGRKVKVAQEFGLPDLSLAAYAEKLKSRGGPS